ncbi:hypothetical protein EV383_1760 [Pseudonocardia sediminis]|uniref:Integrase-like protein n=1 Tax=Pseudonocardia sediminis TaxID=1397368 RepID=A0A4Q7USY8_PSEST|nr:hypothetical protein [Pseudonocardia sediminis]RZT84902.1 hypothetical protein EV383_1760 [Pseudonocardia sediminis]
MTRAKAGRRRQRGTIDRLPSGALRVRVYGGQDPVSGKRNTLVEVIEPGPRQEARAEAARTRLLNAVDEQRSPRTSATLDQLLDRYLETLDVGATTHRAYTRYLELHVRPFLGRTKAGAVGAEALDSLYAELRRCRDHRDRSGRGVDHRTIAGQPLTGARNLTNVIHARLRDRQRFEPQVGTWADRVPALDDPHMGRYLDRLAEHLDQRTADLGAATAAEPPRWAVDLLGQVPDRDDAEACAEWERKVGAVAACRALTGREDADDADTGPAEALDVLGAAPKPGMVEHHAVYCAGWEALGRPRADREELGLSDGALRMRVRAYERQQAWAPRYVATETAGTRQAAEHHRSAAVLHRAEADAATDPARAAELHQAADGAAALAAELDRRTGELEEVEATRGRWLLRTAVDRDKHDRAVIALAHRNSDRDAPDERVTADEWLTARDEAMRAEDEHRPITEHDLDDHTTDEHEALDDSPVLEAAVPDLPETAAAEPRERHEDDVRVPTTGESEDAVTRARRALDEIQAQEVYEAGLDTPEARDADAREDPYADQSGDGEDDYDDRWG